MNWEEVFARYLIEQQIKDENESPKDTWIKGFYQGSASSTRAYAKAFCSRCGLNYDELYNEEKKKFEGVAV